MRTTLIIVATLAIACRARSDLSWTERLSILDHMKEVTFALPSNTKAASIGIEYDMLFGAIRAEQTLKAINDHDLDTIYSAAYMAAFFMMERRYVHDMTSIATELQARGLASSKHYLQMHEMLVRARMLAEANELARQHPLPELKVLPEVREASSVAAGGPTELAIDPNTHTLTRRAVDVHQPAQVIAVTSPMCHFSQDAMEAIQGDPLLSELFGEHTTWLAPQDAALDLDVFMRWNREHPGKESTWAFKHQEWPMIDYWGTPTFYFLENGVISAKVSGWPKQGRRSELLAAFRQVGLLQ